MSGTPAPAQILTDEPSCGQTILVWSNVADLQAGVTESISYTVTHTAALDVGSSFTNRASAYVSQDPRVVPTYDPAIDGITNPTAFGRDDNVSATTELVPFILTKTEPNTEGELLRGLHDHQTVYTLEIENNHLGATNTFAIEDWIPAGMELLGCGLVDNSTVGDEYPGSGAINPGNAPTMTNPCIDPDVVETIVTDPPEPLASAVYTHVVWNSTTLATSLAASGIARFDYIAAIPMWENTTIWTNGEPATTGLQASNLDNNEPLGTSTEETGTEQQMTNTARATGTYSGNNQSYHDDDDMAVSAEDLSIHKSVDNSVITHGITSNWTPLVETSEYTGLAGILDPGIPGVDVQLTWYGVDGIAGTADDVVLTTTTDAGGNYSVVIDTTTLPAGMAPTFDEDATLDDQTTFSLADGEDHLTADFGITGPVRSAISCGSISMATVSRTPVLRSIPKMKTAISTRIRRSLSVMAPVT